MSIAKPPLRTLVCSACVVLALASSLIQGRGGVGGLLGLTDDLDNGGVAAWNYIGLAGGHPSKNYRYKPDADFGNNSLAHSGERLDGGFRNTAMPSGAARATKTYALGAHGDLDAGQAPDIGPADAPAGSWAGPDHPYGYLANNPFSGVEYLGLWNTSSWFQNWLYNPVWNLRSQGSGWFSQGGPAGQFYEATTQLPVFNFVRAGIERWTLEDAFSGARLTRGEANLRLAVAAIDTALVVGPAMGAMRSVAALRAAGSVWSVEAEAAVAYRNASRLSPLAAETTVDKSWKALIEGTVQKTGTPGHQFRTYREAINMAKSGEYSRIRLNRAYSTTDEVQSLSRRRPDILGIRRDGRVDAVEVPSRTDDPRALFNRNWDVFEDLSDLRRGYVIIAPIR